MKLSKSKLALAKVINENGGWPERALWAVQDNCIAFFLGGKPEYKSGDRCWYSNSIDGACVGTITCDEKVTNWHQTILSREEYYQAYPKADEDGWIEWKGGDCPVHGTVMVDTKHRCDRIDIRRRADTAWWDHRDRVGDIVSYRLHRPEVKPEFCESVMRSIPEPESIDGLCAKVTEENKHQHVDAKPTIEQLAHDYRNAKHYADRLQKEAGEAAVKAEEFAVEIRKKILEFQELIGISKQELEPELVITDWRELKIGDEVKYISGTTDECNGMVGIICKIDGRSDCARYRIKVSFDRISRWCDKWEFIRRP
jgi:hypothetical protein